MTSASEIQPPLGLGSGIEALRAKRGWIIALGIIYVIAGHRTDKAVRRRYGLASSRSITEESRFAVRSVPASTMSFIKMRSSRSIGCL